MREPDGDIDLGFENEDNQSPIDINSELWTRR